MFHTGNLLELCIFALSYISGFSTECEEGGGIAGGGVGFTDRATAGGGVGFTDRATGVCIVAGGGTGNVHP
jgi:hypothetical protein